MGAPLLILLRQQTTVKMLEALSPPVSKGCIGPHLQPLPLVTGKYMTNKGLTSFFCHRRQPYTKDSSRRLHAVGVSCPHIECWFRSAGDVLGCKDVILVLLHACMNKTFLRSCWDGSTPCHVRHVANGTCSWHPSIFRGLSWDPLKWDGFAA